MNKALLLGAAALALVPFTSMAATYHYVNTSGETASVEAPDAQTALAIAPDRHPNSGVAIDEGMIDDGEDVTAPAASASGDTSLYGTGGADTYSYVNQAGVTAMVTAPNPETALVTAPNIDEHSGVVIYVGDIEPGTPVPNVD
jgi:hypothetical protein